MPLSQQGFGGGATSLFRASAGGGATPLEQLYTTPNTHSLSIFGPQTVHVFLCGGGGRTSGSNTGVGGPGGFFKFEIPFPAGETVVEIGVGAERYSQSNSYPMRGGQGFTNNNGTSYGGSHISGGGGGSYIKITSGGAGMANKNNYLAAVGGGGGAAVHSFNSNIGGIGYGHGGSSYSNSYQNSGHAGNNGYNTSGEAGTAQSSGWAGGAANNLNQMVGGDAAGQSYMGGAGGGGFGGGGGGGAGSSSSGSAGRAGGYFSMSTGSSLGMVRIRPGGGGGGGSHGNACGATGGGGGCLLFVDYTPQGWSTAQLLRGGTNYTTANANITDWGYAYTQLGNIAGSSTQSSLNNKGGENENGFVYIKTKSLGQTI